MPIVLPNGSAVPTAEEMMTALARPLPGNVALRDWFQEKRGRRAGLAHLLNVSVSTVSGWGKKNQPSYPREPAHLFAIAELCGIPLTAWVQASELEALEPILSNWRDYVYVPASRRKEVDPRQICIDEYLATKAAAVSADEQHDADTAAAQDASDEEVLDIDSMMGDAK